ncbi:hypothetical protein SKAU_G00385390 [Synaphobranchus kaupii]|uniref:Uncharacterized protein n=1 Tax=Synaphobranchus kaupii TaxID=118154 RepID=A0A9Q1IF39_SYNKA|nr:hypothetical protein SKAU_G00385390 [Synaphobranchus kaupii]
MCPETFQQGYQQAGIHQQPSLEGRHSLPPRALGVEPSITSSSGTVSLWHGAATPPLELGLQLGLRLPVLPPVPHLRCLKAMGICGIVHPLDCISADNSHFDPYRD